MRGIALGALEEPAFRRFFVGNAVSALGSRISPLALTFGILGSGASTADLGLVLGASAVPTLLLVLLGGVIGDRLERRRILIGTDLVMAACQGATAWLFLSGIAQIWQLVGIQLVMGTADAFFSPGVHRHRARHREPAAAAAGQLAARHLAQPQRNHRAGDRRHPGGGQLARLGADPSTRRPSW